MTRKKKNKNVKPPIEEKGRTFAPIDERVVFPRQVIKAAEIVNAYYKPHAYISAVTVLNAYAKEIELLGPLLRLGTPYEKAQVLASYSKVSLSLANILSVSEC